MSVQPIVTLYVKNLVDYHTAHIETIAGAVMSATGLAVILAAPRLGRLSDHIDYQNVSCSVISLQELFYPSKHL